MMYEEFEKIAGYKVSYEDYTNIIEPMYMATNLDKHEFVKTIDRKRFEVKEQKSDEMLRMESEIKEEIERIKESIEWHKQRIDLYNEYYKLDTDKAWKVNIKHDKMMIKELKNRISSLKFVIA